MSDEVPKTKILPDDNEPNHGNLVRQVLSYLNFSWISFIVTLIVFTIPFALLVFSISILDFFTKLELIAIYLIIVSLLYILVLFSTKQVSNLWKRSEIERDITSLYDQLDTEKFFPTLIKINFRHTDKYYLQAQVQADKSFYLSAGAAVVSLLIIVSGIAMLYVKPDGTDIKPAVITLTAGVLGEFISTVFFYLYNRTVSEMSNYHQKLVLTQNISLAMKIADSLDDKEAKSKAQAVLIDCLTKDINMYLTMHGSKPLNEPSNGKSKTPNKNAPV
jgi:hypothetical protein